MCFILPSIILLAILSVGLGFYALIAGQVPLIRGTIRGPLVRVAGLLWIVSTLVFLPMVLRALAGLAMNLGR